MISSRRNIKNQTLMLRKVIIWKKHETMIMLRKENKRTIMKKVMIEKNNVISDISQNTW